MAQVKIWHLDWESEEYARLAGESLSSSFLKLGAYAEIGWHGEFDRGLHDVTMGDSGVQRNVIWFLQSVSDFIELKRKEGDYGEERLAREAVNSVLRAFWDKFDDRWVSNSEITKLFSAALGRSSAWSSGGYGQTMGLCAEVWSVVMKEPCEAFTVSRKLAPLQYARAICPKTKKAEVEELLKIAVVDRLPLRVEGTGPYSSNKPFLAYLDVADVPADRWQEKVKGAFGDEAEYLGLWEE